MQVNNSKFAVTPPTRQARAADPAPVQASPGQTETFESSETSNPLKKTWNAVSEKWNGLDFDQKADTVVGSLWVGAGVTAATVAPAATLAFATAAASGLAAVAVVVGTAYLWLSAAP